MGRKERKKSAGSHQDSLAKNQPVAKTDATFRGPKTLKKNTINHTLQTSFVRKMVDPETAKYFNEISNILEGTEIDIEERSVICGNALEEARGKEVELATDYIISHTMQTLLEGCPVDQLCAFLRSSAKQFSFIVMDRSGSHVAETALKSLAMYLLDDDCQSLIEETLTELCQEIVVHSVDIMCNCYGSHVLRRLLCFCKGVSVDSSEFHGTNTSGVLAKRLSMRPPEFENSELQQNQSFPDQFMFLISEMVNPSRVDISTIQINQYGSLVLQTALKLLAGNEQELLRIIPILLGCRMDGEFERNLIKTTDVNEIQYLLEENGYSHLMEVILAVSPSALYNEILTNVFRASLFKMASHPRVNFVVQSVISQATNHEHIKLIWEELGSKFKSLFEMGRSGVVTALLAACQRLQIHEHECCQALADSVCTMNDPSPSIVPRILFVDNYFSSNDKANWNWPNGVKMHVLGSLILQSVFNFPSEYIQVYITSIISLEINHILETSKDPTGSRVIEAFLNSNASAKQKRKLVTKLQGHFGELSVHPSGSFVIDKCFSVSNISLREAIVAELSHVQIELSKTKQGPYLLRKLDVEGFSKRPDQWRSSQVSKQSIYKEFYAAFGPKDAKSSRSENFLADTSHNSHAETLKGMRNEINTFLSSGSLSLTHKNHNMPKGSVNNRVSESSGFPKDDGHSFKIKNKRLKTENDSSFTNFSPKYGKMRREKLLIVQDDKKRRRKHGF